MEHWLNFYQYLPYYIDPTALSLGFLKVDWYSLMYLVAFWVVYILLTWRIKKGELNSKLDKNKLLDLLFWAFMGLLIGARLGYVFLYNLSYFVENPLAIISPFDPVTHAFRGIYGLSYHGGLLGALAAAYIFARRRSLDFWKLANCVIPAIPAGYFFGRLGNFFNGELFGRVTDKAWGMYFPADLSGSLRYPSQLIEAVLEGAVLFIILWKGRNHYYIKENALGIYMIGYGAARVFGEFFRQPDVQIGLYLNFITLGQILSLIMIIGGAILIVKKKHK